MAVAEHIVQRVSQLRAEQAHWEGVRQQASAALLERANRDSSADPEAGFYLNDEQEQLRSQVSVAVFHFQEIGQELSQIREQLEAEQREAGAHDPELVRQELVKRDDALKEQLLKESADKAEALRKDEQQKASALEKEQRDKEFFDKKDSDRLEALAKDEQQRQEALAKDEQDKETLAKAELATQESAQSDLEFLASINEEWEYIQAQIAEEFEYIQQEIAKELEYVKQEIGKEWDYVDQEIRKDVRYSAEQAGDAVAEAVFEVKTAIQNPVDQKEAKEFLDARSEALADFVSGEDFKAAPADHKEMWLREKLMDTWRAENETFGDRNDNFGVRAVVKEGLADLQDTLLKAVEEERKIEAAVNKEVEAREQVHAATAARLEKSGAPPDVLEQKLQQLDDVAKKMEQATRDQAEARRQEVWEKAEAELRERTAEAREQAERQDAEKRKEAERQFTRDF